MKDLPNILIVDDIPSNLTYLKIILKGIEANLIEAESGQEALRKIEGVTLSLAILDVQMAGMNGFELAVKLNENRVTNSVPIIFLTAAFPNNEQILSGYESGAVDYIIKPLNRKILTSKVNIFLQLFLQKQLIVESHEDLRRSEMELLKTKEQLEQLNFHIINAREEERAAISMLIHDELGQALTALKIDISWAGKNLGNEVTPSKMEKMIGAINTIIRKVQRISAELHPKLLTDLGLADAIEWFCGEMKERTGLRFELALEEAEHNAFKTDLALFRILQEALTNVVRHAQATTVAVAIRHVDGGTRMTISDDGIGCEEGILESSKSMGLFGMKERARQCNGTLTLEPNRPVGTKVTVFLPINSEIT